MPIYEYACLDCDARFDALRPMRDSDAPIACKHCASDHTSRKISAFYAHSDGRSVAGASSSCASCSSTSCSTCSSRP